MYTLSDYVDIPRLVTDTQYAYDHQLLVKSPKLNHLKEIDQRLRDIKSDDPEWKEKVMSLKREKANEIKITSKGLHVIKYKKSSLNKTNVKTLGLFRSVITDGEKVVCFAPPKSLSIEHFNQNLSHTSNLVVSEFVEGTMINMFINPHTNDWEIATRSNVGARCKFYQDEEKTFREMFLEAFTEMNYEFDMFNKEYSYSWVLQHPSNRIVIPLTKPNLYLTHVFDYSDFIDANGKKTFLVENILTSENKYELIKCESKINTPQLQHYISTEDALLSFDDNSVDYKIMGSVFQDLNTGLRTKVRNPHYEYVKNLKGNSPKLQYRYYSLRQLGAVKDYLRYYPEDSGKFNIFREQMHKFTDSLWRNYMRCYVHKEKPLKEFPYQYRTHMFQMHQYYLSNLRREGGKFDKLQTINYVNALKPGHLMHCINYPLKMRTKDANHQILIDHVDKMEKGEILKSEC